MEYFKSENMVYRRIDESTYEYVFCCGYENGSFGNGFNRITGDPEYIDQAIRGLDKTTEKEWYQALASFITKAITFKQMIQQYNLKQDLSDCILATSIEQLKTVAVVFVINEQQTAINVQGTFQQLENKWKDNQAFYARMKELITTGHIYYKD